jgi:hypothetical protein
VKSLHNKIIDDKEREILFLLFIHQTTAPAVSTLSVDVYLTSLERVVTAFTTILIKELKI